MTTINQNTKKAEAMVGEFNHSYVSHDIYGAYRNPSSAKVRSYNDILRRAIDTEGYNHDLKVTSATCHHYSTMYSYTTAEGETYIVKDTHANTYITKLA